MSQKSDKAITIFEIFLTFLFLGFTSFGGPIAHVAFFRETLIKNKKWLEEEKFADYLALCQFLPGPTSSQLGIAIGFDKSGIRGACVAWFAFTFPSAFLMILFGYGILNYNEIIPIGALHGLKIAVVSVVAYAILDMAKSLTPDFKRKIFALIIAVFLVFNSGPLIQMLSILLGAIFGIISSKKRNINKLGFLQVKNEQKLLSSFSLLIFLFLLIILPFFSKSFDNNTIKIFDTFYRSGSLVFGGGHVVLPLLQSQVVPQNWVNTNDFMAGYGLAQAIPGPLFAFCAYLGTIMIPEPNGWQGGIICLFAIFLPSFLLVFGILPYWEIFRKQKYVQEALKGVNASVVGLLTATFLNPVLTNAIVKIEDIILAIALLALLFFSKLSSVFIVIIATIFGWIFTLI